MYREKPGPWDRAYRVRGPAVRRGQMARSGGDRFAGLNRANWDERAPAHAASPDYAVERFAEDPGHLSEVVRFDLPLLGDISGLRGVHLQCHIGTDTVSLARLGATDDRAGLLRPSLARPAASRRAGRRRATFVEPDVYDAPGRARPAGRSTSSTPGSARCAGCRTSAAGPASSPALLRRAAGCSSARAIRCSGRSTTPRPDGLLAVEYPYFEREQPMVCDEAGHLRRDRRRLHPQH